MKLSKTKIIFSLLIMGLFIFSNNAFAQQETEAKKKIVIVKKTIDKDGNEVIEKVVKEGTEADDFDVDQYLKEHDSDEAKEVDVDVTVTNGKESGKRTVEVTVEGDNVIIKEGGDERVINLEEESSRKEITTDDGRHIIIMKKEGEEDKELIGDVEVLIDEDGNQEIEISYSEKPQGAFFGVMVNPEEEGVKLLDVVEDSPAQKSGLQKGDILLNINEHKISSYEELTNVLSKYEVGATVVVVYERDGNVNKVATKLVDAQDIPTEKMIWKVKEGEEIKLKGNHEFIIEEENENGKKKIKKRIIIKEDH